MSAFLSSVVGYVITAVISALGGWLLKVLHGWQQDKATDKKEADSVKPLKDAKTGEEIDKASDAALGGF